MNTSQHWNYPIVAFKLVGEKNVRSLQYWILFTPFFLISINTNYLSISILALISFYLFPFDLNIAKLH